FFFFLWPEGPLCFLPREALLPPELGFFSRCGCAPPSPHSSPRRQTPARAYASNLRIITPRACVPRSAAGVPGRPTVRASRRGEEGSRTAAEGYLGGGQSGRSSSTGGYAAAKPPATAKSGDRGSWANGPG